MDNNVREAPDVLYHYCSLETLLSILENNSIWLSDITKANDEEELKWLKKEYYKYILSIYESTDDERKKNNCRFILNYAISEGFEIPYYGLVSRDQSFYDLAKAINCNKVYAFCLSQKKDLLSQWRGYAKDGTGVCIGFKSNYFKQISNKFGYIGYSYFSFANVNYRLNFDNSFDTMFEKFMGESVDVAGELIEQLTQLETLAAYFKNPCFKEEQEWRVAYTTHFHNLDSESFIFSQYNFTSEYYSKFKLPYYQRSIRNNQINLHIEIPFISIGDAIAEIILGPKCNTSVSDLKDYLIYRRILQNDYDESIKIKSSVCSYK